MGSELDRKAGDPMSERETALQITERIIREHDTFCVGHYLPDAAWCSCAPSDEPLCDSCRALAEKITEAIDAAASLPPDAAPQTCEWREIATAPKDGTRVLTPTRRLARWAGRAPEWDDDDATGEGDDAAGEGADDAAPGSVIEQEVGARRNTFSHAARRRGR